MDLEANLGVIRERIRNACDRAGRNESEVLLMAVTKSQPAAAVEAAAALGVTLFGENKVQEAKGKIGLCSGKLRWHMIGHLQSNKAREAVGLFEMIQSIDSFHLAEEVNRRAEQASKNVPILLEINVAGEASKFGYGPEKLLADFQALNALPRLAIHGLMTVPPYTTDVDRLRPIFRKMADLKRRCEDILGAPLPHLSMGMSGDYEVAIEEGATMVRIGTALFGERAKAAK